MFEIYHPQEEFTGISYGLKFVRSKAATENKPLAERFRSLGFRVGEVVEAPAKAAEPKAPAPKAPAKPAAAKPAKGE